MTKHSYTAADVEQLNWSRAVRANPGMYVGDAREHGLHHILWEIISNSLDEATAGFGKHIEITLEKDGSATVTDYARGIPVEWKPEAQRSALTLLFTALHAGGKFKDKERDPKRGGSVYASSGGMHGIGTKACNALSAWMEVEVRRHGLKFIQRFEQGGDKSTPVEVYDADDQIGEVTADFVMELDKNQLATKVLVKGKPIKFKRYKDTQTGTKVSFLPARAFFDAKAFNWTKDNVVPWDAERLKDRLRQAAFLNPGIKFKFTDKRSGETEVFESDKGLLGYLDWLNDGHEPLHKPIVIERDVPMEVNDQPHTLKIHIALQYAGDRTHIQSFVNNIPTPQGGKHVQGFQSGLMKAVKNFADEKNLIKKEELRSEDVLLGLTAIIACDLSWTPQFQGQTKDALNSPEVYGPMLSTVYEFMQGYLGKNIPVGKLIVNQALASAHGREAAQLARQAVISRGGGLDDVGSELTIKKLADIQRRNGQPLVPVEHTALFIVEGDSAGGSAKQGRTATHQAILALKGKIDNVWDKKLADILKSPEIATILRAIGGVDDKGETFDPEQMRYGRVALMADADDDGAHIICLLITLFWKMRPELIKAGRLFVSRPPLYQVRPKKGEPRYAYTEAERQALIKQFGGQTGVHVQRYKGLGEMNAAQLNETALALPSGAFNGSADKLTREDFARHAHEVRVTIDDAKQMTKMLELLMGRSVEHRREWLMGEGWRGEQD
jgi:DNA gyrase subunit B